MKHEGWADQDATWVEVPANGMVEHRPRLYLIPARDRPNASPTEGQGTAVERVKAPTAPGSSSRDRRFREESSAIPVATVDAIDRTA